MKCKDHFFALLWF